MFQSEQEVSKILQESCQITSVLLADHYLGIS